MNKLTIATLLSFLIVMLPVCFAAEINLVYDTNGNLVTGDNLYREYNSLNQLVTVRNGSSAVSPILQEFTHDPVEERIVVKKSYNSDSSVKETVYYFNKDYVRVVNSSGTFNTQYVSLEGQNVAEIRNDGSKVFIHADHLGSSSVITDESGTVIENTTYSPFGEVLTGGTASRFDYEGKEYDSATGQYDFHFRGYRADWGIFTQPDTLIPNVYDPQSLNRYMFERGNPLKNTDPSGHVFGATVFTVLLVIFIIGLIISSDTIVPIQENKKTAVDYGYYTQDYHGGVMEDQENTISVDDSAIISDNAMISADNKITETSPKGATIVNLQEEEEDNLLDGHYTKIQVDDKGLSYQVTFNQKDQEVARKLIDGSNDLYYGGGYDASQSISHWLGLTPQGDDEDDDDDDDD